MNIRAKISLLLLLIPFAVHGQLVTDRPEASSVADTDVFWIFNTAGTADFKVPFSLLKTEIGPPEGTEILSTGEVGGTKFLREDGDDTSSWQVVPGGAFEADVNTLITPTTPIVLNGSSGTEAAFSILTAYSQTSTAGGTDHLINRTVTTVGSGPQRYLDMQTGSVTASYFDAVAGQLVLDDAQVFGVTTGIAFGDGNTRIYETSDNFISFDFDGAVQWKLNASGFSASRALGPAVVSVNASATVPTLRPSRGDGDTGTGSAAANQLSHIVGDKEAMRNEGDGPIIINRMDAGDNAAGNIGAWTNVKSAIATVSSSAAATLTASNLVPAGSFLIGLTARITTSFGTSTGLTDFDVGDGSTVDRWANSLAITGGTTMDLTDATANAGGWFTSANDVVLTAVGGNFDGDGVIELIAHYIDLTAPTG